MGRSGGGDVSKGAGGGLWEDRFGQIARAGFFLALRPGGCTIGYTSFCTDRYGIGRPGPVRSAGPPTGPQAPSPSGGEIDPHFHTQLCGLRG